MSDVILLNRLGVSDYECKGGNENRFHDMAKIIKSMQTKLLTGFDPLFEAPSKLVNKAEKLAYDIDTKLYDAMELLEKLDKITFTQEQVYEQEFQSLTQADRNIAQEIMNEISGENREARMIEALNGNFGPDYRFTEKHLVDLGLGVTI